MTTKINGEKKFPPTPESIERLFVQEFTLPFSGGMYGYYLLGRDKNTGKYNNFFWDGVADLWNEMTTVNDKPGML